jgi:hypothetical protein
MTKRDAEAIFREHYLPGIRQREQEYGGGPDYIMRSEEWLNFVDGLQKDREITGDQADKWLHPDFCSSLKYKQAQRLDRVRAIMES